MPRHSNSPLPVPQPAAYIPNSANASAGPSHHLPAPSAQLFASGTGSKRRRSKSRPWSSVSASVELQASGSGSAGGEQQQAEGGWGTPGGKKRKRKGTMSVPTNGSASGRGRESVVSGSESGGSEQEAGGGSSREKVVGGGGERSRFFSGEGAAAGAAPASSSKDRKGKGKARVSLPKDLSMDEGGGSRSRSPEKKEKVRKQITPALALPVAAAEPGAGPSTSSAIGAADVLKERARRMKEVEEQAKERADKEAEMKELKAGDERLRRELGFKDSELEAQKDTLLKVKDSLTCNICMELLWQPYIISPCGHTACFACLKSWFLSPPAPDQPLLPVRQRPKSCPACRGTVLAPPTPIYLIKDLVHSVAGRLSLLDAGARQPEPEGAEPWAGIFEEGAILRRGMRDDEDGVDRCVECGHEIDDGYCTNCGAEYLVEDESDGELEAEDLVGYLYGDGQDDGDDGPQFEFEDGSESGSDGPGSDRGSVLTDDGFLVDDDETILDGTDSEQDEESAEEGGGLDEDMARDVLIARGATDAMIDRYHLKITGHDMRALIPSTLYPDTPYRLPIRNDIHLPPTDPFGDRFILTTLRGSRAGRDWLRKEKAARAATGPAAGGRRRRPAARGQREFSLGSFDEEEGPEGRMIDLESDEEDEVQHQRRARSNGVPPSVGSRGRTIELSDSDEDKEEEDDDDNDPVVAVPSRQGGGPGEGGKKKRRVVSTDEEEEDVQISVGGRGRRKAKASESESRRPPAPSLPSSSASPEPQPSRRARIVSSSSLSNPNSSDHSNSKSGSDSSDSDPPSSHSSRTKSGLAHFRSIYGAGDDSDVLVASDDDGVNMLGDGGRNDEGPDALGEGYDEEGEEWNAEGGGAEDGEGAEGGEIWY